MTVTVVLLWALVCYVVWSVLHSAQQRLSRSPLDNIPGPPLKSFWTGNLHQFFDRHGLGFHRELAQDYGPVVKIYGSFGRRILYIYDPKALHTMIIKEQSTFEEGSSFINANLLLFGPGLLSTLGEQHRKQRKMLNPVFSINHMRHLLPTFYQAVHRLRIAIVSEINRGQEEIDVLDWMGRISLELIGQGGLGYSFDPLVEDVKDDYGEALKSTFAALQGVFILRPLLPYVSSLGPAWFRRRILEVTPYEPVRRIKNLVDTMADRSAEIFRVKKTALLQGDETVVRQVGEGKDIMSILMKMNMVAADEDRLQESELVAQVSTMTLAATDTTSNTLCRILQLLSQHPEVQKRLRKEILEACTGDDLPYDDLNQLALLDAVLRETLRLYPPATLLSREATKDTILPLSQPIHGVDGQEISEIPIPTGTEIFVGVLGSNTCKAIWGEDALEWKPDRWLAPLPDSALDAPIPGVYSKLMSFLGGKRSCIGFKFAEVEIKAVLSVLLQTLSFSETDKPIAWNVATVTYPTVGTESVKPQMPLNVRLMVGESS